MKLQFPTPAIVLVALALTLVAGCPPAPVPVEPVGPLAFYSATPTSGPGPLTVTFTDESQPGTSPITIWRWDFGDGTSSSAQNPTHTYAKKGKYTVTLSVATAVTVDRRTDFDFIEVLGDGKPEARFSTTTTGGELPFTASFRDTSLANGEAITDWAWNFGDGGASDDQNPRHTYTKIGSFDVSLTVTNPVGSGTLKRTRLILTHTFNPSFGGAGAERTFGLAETIEGRFVLVGERQSGGAAGQDLYFVKTDALGNAGAEVASGEPGNDYAAGLAAVGDGGFVLAGAAAVVDQGLDVLLTRTDSNGARLWSQTYGGTGNDSAAAVIATDDGGYLLAGSTATPANGLDALLIKTDEDGRLVWTLSYGGAGLDFANAVASAPDGGYFVAGATGSQGVGGLDMWVLRLDFQGNVLWQFVTGGTRDDTAAGVAAVGEDGCIVAGQSASGGPSGLDALLVRLDANGTPLWQRNEQDAGDDRALAVVALANGDFAYAGSATGVGAGLQDALLVRLDAQGVRRWAKTYGGPNGDRANALIVTADGGFAFAGSTESFGPAGVNAYLVKTDAQGVPLRFPAQP